MSTCQRRSTVCLLLAILAIVSVGGCKTPLAEQVKLPKLAKLNQHMPWYNEELPREGVPTKIVGNWTDAVLYQEGQKPQRGFGGRLLFYDNESQKPILVDGQLVVYAFNEVGRAPTDNMPTLRYVIPAVELPKHMSTCELGASYSVWLPWDEVGGPKTEVSLVCRFEPKAGAVVVSEQTRHYLAGSELPDSVAAAGGKPKIPEGVPFKPAVEQATYNAPVSGANAATAAAGGEGTLPNAPRTMTSTTIALPASMRNLGPGMTAAPQVPNAAARTLPNYRAPATGQNEAAGPSAMNQSRLNAPPTATRLDGIRSAPFPSMSRPTMSHSSLSGAAQSYPPPKVIQESPQQAQLSNSQPGPTTANSVQSSTLGYNHHPLATPSANSIAPIGDPTAASVSYPAVSYR
jgi:hypothetical protein